MFYKKTISKYLQTNYSDKNLAKLLTACEAGAVIYENWTSCLISRADGGYVHQEQTRDGRNAEVAFLHFQECSGLLAYGPKASNKNLAKLVIKEQKRRAKIQQEYEAEGQRLTAELLKPSTLNLNVNTKPVKTKADDLEETAA